MTRSWLIPLNGDVVSSNGMTNPVQRILMIDIGGGSVKLMVSGRRMVRTFETGPCLRPRELVAEVERRTADWPFEVISIGYPGPVRDGRPKGDPPRVGTGWMHFNYERAFDRPVRFINDAAMQALAAYRGGRMLFIGLGTGPGSTLICNDILVPLELGWLRYDRRRSLLQQLADSSPQRIGYRRWRRDVIAEVGNLKAAFDVDRVVLGGGNAPRVRPLPRYCRLQSNSEAFRGAVRLWGDRAGVIAEPRGSFWTIRGL